MWLKDNQQPPKKKGNGHGVHISDWICETTGQLVLSEEQIARQLQLPPEVQLKATDAAKSYILVKTMMPGGIFLNSWTRLKLP
jgi:hypothetical protein